MSIKRESLSGACSFILHLINELATSTDPSSSIKLIRLAVYDIGTKAAQLVPAQRLKLFNKVRTALSQLSGSQLAAIDIDWLEDCLVRKTLDRRERPHADVAIITVINAEQTAVKRVFDIDDAEADFELNGRDFYLTEVSGRSGRKGDLSVLVTMVGEPRNVPCANVCRDILENWDVDLLILCGIAGARGDKEQLRLAHVVAPHTLFYVEGGKTHRRTNFIWRLEGRWGKNVDDVIQRLAGVLQAHDYTEPEIVPKTLREPISAYLRNFEPRESQIIQSSNSILAKYLDEELGAAERTITSTRLHRKNSMCGEKVLVNDGVKKLAGEIDRNLYSVDMESYGFAEACDHCGAPWIVFRGISDYADIKKDDGRHAAASVVAANMVRMFLQISYRKPAERLEF